MGLHGILHRVTSFFIKIAAEWINRKLFLLLEGVVKSKADSAIWVLQPFQNRGMGFGKFDIHFSDLEVQFWIFYLPITSFRP
jgi:hypothetical protein